MLLATAVLMLGSVQAAKKVHTIGDSTMADYDPSSTDKRGWCQMLQQFFDGITVNNRGKSGASSKSFYKESPYWPTMVTGSGKIQSGDFVLIQFAHNDEKSNGTDGDEENAYHTQAGDGKSVDYRGTTPYDTYKQYLRKYIEETKALGGKPILVGPICRKYFSGNTIRRNGRHDLGDSFNKLTESGVTTGNKLPADDHTMDYPYQMQQVAMEYDDVPYIDLTTATAELYLSYGDAYCTSNLFCSDDSTHPQGMGATLIARLFAQLLKNQAEGGEPDAKRKAVLQELAQYVQISSDISFSPSTGDMGKAYSGQQIVKEYNISAFGLTPAAGTFTITTDGNFYVSVDKQNYMQSVSVDYTGNTLITTIYVKTTIAAGGVVTGLLTASNGTVTKTLELTAEGVDISGGEATNCVWPLNSNDGSAVSDVFSAADVKVVGMTGIKGTVQPTTPEGHGKMAYFDIEGSTWPAGEIDENSTRYIQFQATVPSEMTIDVSNISFDVCGWGGNTVSYHAYYATKADFSDQVLIGEAVKMSAKAANSVSYDLTTSLEEGESIYIRIYPWLNGLSSDATGKYIALSDVAINGMAKKAGGIDVTGSITYKLDKGGLDQDAELNPMELQAGIAGMKWTAGASLTLNGTTTYTGQNNEKTVMTSVYNGTGSSFPGTATDANTMTLTLTPEDGFYFMPAKVSFEGARFGTDGGKLTVSVEAGSNKVELCSSAEVNRSGKNLDIAKFSYDVSSLMASNNEPLKLNFAFVGLGNTKTMGLANLVIEGQLTGSASTATKYELNTLVTPAEAGSIEKDPDLASYKEGTQVTLKAVRNFGYHFKEWQDASGAVVAATPEVTITMDSEKTMKAVFEKVPVYTITTRVTNDADRTLGSVTLTPNEHNNQYEAGSEITATANESKILKFMQWTDQNENAGTTATRTLTVNSNMELVANYEVQDFIAVFDASANNYYAYPTTSGYPFPADITWDNERNASSAVVKVRDGSLVYTKDGGTPVVRNREGVVLSGINGLYQNGYSTTDIAFQYQFSTKGFTAATFTADMAAKNMASKNWKALLSTDGTTFTAIDGAAWTMTANAKMPLSIELPAEAIGLETVYLRIMGDGDEMLSSSYQFDQEFDGLKYTSHSESGVGNVYVLGTAEVVEDSQAPVVTTTLPADNDEDVSATGRITISYDERITAGDDTQSVTLQGADETIILTPIWSSRSVSFNYMGLAYGTQYTFSLPAGYVADRSGNTADALTLTFTTMERKQPEQRLYDAIVDAGATGSVSGDGIATYTTVQAAVDAAPTGRAKPWLVFIKNGQYKEHVDIPKNKPYIHLIGQDRDKAVILDDRLSGGDNAVHVSVGATVVVNADNCFFENLTMENSYGHEKQAGPQALALNTIGDRIAMNNVALLSYQDTWITTSNQKNRHYIKNSLIEGAVDFIYNGGDVYLDGDTLEINRPSGGYIVAPWHTAETKWGYVFKNNVIRPHSRVNVTDVWLGRPWHGEPKTVFINTQTFVNIPAKGWYNTMGGLPELWADYNTVDANGNPLDLSQRESYYYYIDSNTGQKVEKFNVKNYLTDEEAAQYTIKNVMSGNDSWQPDLMCEACDAPQVKGANGKLTWDAVPYAICYVVTKNGEVAGFTTETEFDGYSDDDKWYVQAVNEFGGLSKKAAANGTTTAIEISNVTPTAVVAEVYTVDGKRIQQMQRGLNIVRKSDGSIVKVMKK